MKQRLKGRQVNGILLLDKPKGMTSNAALQTVKRLFAAKKAGHTGSLDPLASGMLPICFGEATKFSQFLLEADKKYIVEATLGIRTSTGDAEGEIISSQAMDNFDIRKVDAVLRDFAGDIHQIPSMYSAIKHNGKPLYYYARQGIEIERKARAVSIYELTLLDADRQHLSLSVHCSKGTYIRTLIEDIGDVLQCGAHVTELRRLEVGTYPREHMVGLDVLEELAEQGRVEELDNYLLPMDSSVTHYQEIQLSELAAFYLKQGQPVLVPRAPSEGWVRLFTTNGKFMGVGEILNDGRVAPRRLITAETHLN